MKNEKLPLGQHQIDGLLKWNINHPGIVPENPKIDLENWKLTVDGEVKNPIELTWPSLLKFPSIESISDFHCVEGWSVRDCRWHGVKFSALVEIVKPSKDAKHVFFRCLDGYTTSLVLESLLKDNVLLAYKLDGRYLEESLGAPLRLVVPDKYAYKSAMWVKQITFTKKKELGYWEKKGYSDTADVWKNDRFARF